MRVRLVRIPLWAAALIAGLILAIGTVLALVAVGVFLLIIPVILIAGVLYHLFGRGPRRAAGDHPRPDGAIIEGDFRVIETERLELDQKPPTKMRPDR
jgi:hypothetical protein